MILFHGTDRRTGDYLLEQGVRREVRDDRGRWYTIGSGVVMYLTDNPDLAAGYAGLMAHENGTVDGYVLAVDVPELGRGLVVDAQAYRVAGLKPPRSWKRSLEEVGSVAYRGALSPRKLELHRIVKARRKMVVRGLGPMIKAAHRQ